VSARRTDLNGLTVLLDGYNLELPKGTGIKAYGLTLIEALGRLGASVQVLFSKKSSDDPVLNEVLFFETPRDGDSRLRYLADALGAATSSFGRPKAKAMRVNGAVVPERGLHDYLHRIGLLNLDGCYNRAFLRYRFTGLKTTIIPPMKIHVFHATSPLPIRIRGARLVTTIHDLIPLKLPYMTLDDKRLFYKNVRLSLRDSDAVIVDSQTTRRDILDVFDVDAKKVSLVYPPVTLSPLSATEDEVAAFLRRYNLRFRQYVLFVGALDPRKNVKRLQQAYGSLDTPWPLVIAGARVRGWKDDISNPLCSNARFLEYVPTDDLRYLYTGAYCFVFPSLYEGFGLPPLEAMTFGCPVITSHVSSLPEVCGEAALYVDPYDADDIARKLETLLSNPRLRERLSVACSDQARRFTLENYCGELLSVYSQIV
jgi:glycosyltransferase involved in cell wall biosynthesis